MSQNEIAILVVMLVGLFGITYFFTIKPQKKRIKQHTNIIDGLNKGDEVMTAGGFIGKVSSIKEDTVILELPPDRVKIKLNKNSIVRNLTEEEDLAEGNAKKDKE